MTVQTLVVNIARFCAAIISAQPAPSNPASPTPAPSFTHEAEQAAHAEGWGIFHFGVREDGSDWTELQGLDDTAPGGPGFSEDVAAWKHVVAQARTGSALHLAALAAVDPMERLLIRFWCSAEDLVV